MTLQQAMESYESLSLRKLAEALGVNYNMLLKASKKPIAGEIYDPTAINYEEIETYISKKHQGEIDYEALAGLDLNSVVKLPFEPKVKMRLTLQRESAGKEYSVEMVTQTHVVIMEIGGTQPRVFSNSTFLHQGPKALLIEPSAENVATIDGPPETEGREESTPKGKKSSKKKSND